MSRHVPVFRYQNNVQRIWLVFHKMFVIPAHDCALSGGEDHAAAEEDPASGPWRTEHMGKEHIVQAWAGQSATEEAVVAVPGMDWEEASGRGEMVAKEVPNLGVFAGVVLALRPWCQVPLVPSFRLGEVREKEIGGDVRWSWELRLLCEHYPARFVPWIAWDCGCVLRG